MNRPAQAAIAALLILLALTAPPVEAHARLKSSRPADASTLANAPESVTLIFSESARLTALTIRGAGNSAARKISIPVINENVSHTIPLPKLAPGTYVLTWRALSDDTHVTSGTVTFSIRPVNPVHK